MRRLGRASCQHAQRVVSQAPQHGRRAGRLMARKIIGLQRGVGLKERMVERSAWSVLGTHRGAQPDSAWREGYAQVVQAMVPALAPSAVATPGTPRWPDAPARRDAPDMEAGE
jgi:hypothetical protein